MRRIRHALLATTSLPTIAWVIQEDLRAALREPLVQYKMGRPA